MALTEKAGRAPGRGRVTALSALSWVLFASSGSLAAAVMAAGWSPAAVTSVRLASAAALLVPVVAVLRPGSLRFGRADLRLLLGYGLLGVGGVQLLFFVAVARIPVGVAMVLVNVAPALVALWVRVVRGTRLPRLVWAGIALASVGSVLVAQVRQGAGLDLLGVAAGLGAALCSAGYFLLGEHGARRHDPAGFTAAGLVIGAVPVAVLAPPWTLPPGSLTAVAVLGGARVPVWPVLLALAVIGTVLPYLAGLRALRDLPVALAGVLALLEPVVAAALAWLLLGQALGPAQLAGAAIVLTGAVLVQLAGPENVAAGLGPRSGRRP
ncbi:EamA family transporter [Nocardia grenadensis]|uniref:EamA family transporter n=1 Tax=Nocardia grenadensis TaxID=931537 RepID=UPI003D7196A3